MNKESKYKILVDYHSEGWKFFSYEKKGETIEEFETIDEAVKEYLSYHYGNPFLVVRIIDWEANSK